MRWPWMVLLLWAACTPTEDGEEGKDSTPPGTVDSDPLPTDETDAPGETDTPAETDDSDLPPVDADDDGWVAELDCDDGNPLVHPGIVHDICDEIDHDCDGQPGVGATFVPAVGPYENLSARLQTGEVWESPIDGVLHLCAGTWTSPLHLRHAVDIRGEAGRQQVILQPDHSRAITVDPGLVVTLVGLTVQNGLQEDGGGVFLSSRSVLTLVDSVLQNNDAANEGGALFLDDDSQARLRDVDLVDNLADAGGAISMRLRTSLYLENTSFARNAAATGGGLLAGEGALIEGARVVFDHNRAPGHGAGVLVRSPSRFSLTDFELRDNTGFSIIDVLEGGDIELLRSTTPIRGNSTFVFSFYANSHLQAEDLDFEDNAGTAMLLDFVPADIRRCRFIRNTPQQEAVVRASGALVIEDSLFEDNQTTSDATLEAESRTTLRDTVFRRNRSTLDAGAVEAGDDLVGERLTFTGNEGRQGGAVQIDRGVLRLTDTVLEDNTATHWGGALATFNTEVYLQRVTASRNSAGMDSGFARFAEESVVTIDDSTIEQSTGTTAGAMRVSHMATLTQVVLRGNSALGADGGAIQLDRDEATIDLRSVTFGLQPNLPHDLVSMDEAFTFGGQVSTTCTGAEGCP